MSVRHVQTKEENQKASKSEIALSFRTVCAKKEFSSQRELLRKIAR